MAICKSKGEKTFSIINYIVLGLLGVVFVLPYLLIIVMSFTSTASYYEKGFSLIPTSLTLEGYKTIFAKDSEIYSAFLSSFIITFFGSIIGLVVTSLSAYALSKKYLKGRGFFNFLLVFAMLFNGGLIPSFLLISQLQMLNTYWAIIIPSALTPWYCILMRSYFQSIPESLEESAKLDGANDFTVLTRIYAFLSMPIVATVSLYFIVGYWNQWSASLLYFDSAHRYMLPITVILREYIQKNTQASGAGGATSIAISMKMATVVVSTIPIICIYPFLQKFLINGLMIGSVKG